MDPYHGWMTCVPKINHMVDILDLNKVVLSGTHLFMELVDLLTA